MDSGGVGGKAPCFERTEALSENAETFLYIAGVFGPYLCTTLHMSLFYIYKRRALANEQWSLYKSSNIVQNGVLICSELLDT